MAQVKIKPTTTSLSELDMPLERDGFCRSVIRELSGLLQDVVGLEEAEGFISVVGQNIGHEINDSYKKVLKVDKLNHEQICQVLEDLKARIQGEFYVVEADENRIVFGNRLCPFAEKVVDRPSLCMMTSNVFGTIAAENAGYAKVELQKTIAQGDSGCQVVVYLQDTAEAQAAEGREYFQTGD
ncbi:MAG: methanogen output domain 1-containing protein [Gammaproteobacteria bacterium]|nr:methanogen output domain 1-containing protein [Gammaproteobacteria bacterium]